MPRPPARRYEDATMHFSQQIPRPVRHGCLSFVNLLMRARPAAQRLGGGRVSPSCNIDGDGNAPRLAGFTALALNKCLISGTKQTRLLSSSADVVPLFIDRRLTNYAEGMQGAINAENRNLAIS